MGTTSRTGNLFWDGVDVEEGIFIQQPCRYYLKTSYNNSPFIEIRFSGGNFRGPQCIYSKTCLIDCFIEASTDGIGTKGILIDAARAMA